MSDHTIQPAILILFVFAILATFVSVCMAIASAFRVLREPVINALTYVIDHTKSPDDGDKLVGYTLLIVCFVFLISDYANDFAMVAMR